MNAQREAFSILANRQHLLLNHLQQDGDCMNWDGSTNKSGYGSIRVGATSVLAHRAAYFIHYGEIPDGMCVCHSCDNPKCCNPNHLFLGSHAENMKDMQGKGRRSGI